MPKAKTVFFCQNCGAQSAKWIGKCPSCHEWNSYVEEVMDTVSQKNTGWRGSENNKTKPNKPIPLHQVTHQSQARLNAHDSELNRVLGGGLVPGSVTLIGGEPGIGKSTLLLQIALKLSLKVLYVSGEESEQQIKMRAERMQIAAENVLLLTETTTQNIFSQIQLVAPELMIIDSIQTLYSNRLDAAAGSVSQIRQCAAELIRFAKETNVPVLMIGHITKEGTIAGPKVLEHMVDTVLQFEGDQHHSYRILRTTKNRFGSTSELGIYEMTSTGLREVSNPSEILISQKDKDLSGVAIGATLEGNRPLLIEVQALVSAANYGTPQRSSTGFDNKRLNMLLAVLEKRGGFRLGVQDVFLNIAGGFRVLDPAIDLAVVIAVVSSQEELTVPEKYCFAAEVGLGGEIRAVSHIEKRISEAAKLGFSTIYISRYNKSTGEKDYKIKVKTFGRLDEIFADLFG
ncbi:MAG: DNA repair protein RadA [Cyclobacteriaceae bacterium]